MMTPEQALTVIRQVCDAWQGNLASARMIDQALTVLDGLVATQEVEVPLVPELDGRGK